MRNHLSTPIRRLLGPAMVALLLVGSPMPAAAGVVSFSLVQDGFSLPDFITNAGDSRLFVVEQNGRIKIIHSNLSVTTFLDISDRVAQNDGERGLLGLAFDPNYSTNGLFYVFYSKAAGGDNVVAEFHVSADPDVANANSERNVLTFEHSSASNHNGGWLGFNGGYLFISTGDGGNTPQLAQDITNLSGKVLRINPHDPDGNGPLHFSTPSDNPFVNKRGRDPIWAYGFRNPWRCSHDTQTGDLWCGDVGQNAYEEVDHAGLGKGKNFGWRLLEGFHYYQYPNKQKGALCKHSCRQRPILEYPHNVAGEGNAAVTGGYVSRRAGATLNGKYVFGDYGSGRIWAIPAGYVRGDPMPEYANTGYKISTFGLGSDGRMYLANIYAGEIYLLDDT